MSVEIFRSTFGKIRLLTAIVRITLTTARV
jgi:hypothetical protein